MDFMTKLVSVLQKNQIRMEVLNEGNIKRASRIARFSHGKKEYNLEFFFESSLFMPAKEGDSYKVEDVRKKCNVIFWHGKMSGEILEFIDLKNVIKAFDVNNNSFQRIMWELGKLVEMTQEELDRATRQRAEARIRYTKMFYGE